MLIPIEERKVLWPGSVRVTNACSASAVRLFECIYSAPRVAPFAAPTPVHWVRVRFRCNPLGCDLRRRHRACVWGEVASLEAALRCVTFSVLLAFFILSQKVLCTVFDCFFIALLMSLYVHHTQPNARRKRHARATRAPFYVNRPCSTRIPRPPPPARKQRIPNPRCRPSVEHSRWGHETKSKRKEWWY